VGLVRAHLDIINEITLRNAQVRRISWVRGVRSAGARFEWPPR